MPDADPGASTDATSPTIAAFVPPETAPAVSPAVSPAVVPQSIYAPPTSAGFGTAPGTAANSAPGQRPNPRRRSRIVLLIVVAALVVVGLIVWWVASIVTNIGEAIRFGAPLSQELLEGEPGSPVAVTPMECSVACFTVESVPALLPSEAAFLEIGLTEELIPYGTYDPGTVGELYRGQIAAWESDDGEPDSCFFAPTNSPFAVRPDPALASNTDPIVFAGTHSDSARANVLDISMRMFPDSASASQYLSELSESIEACDEIAVGPPSDRYHATIDPEAALSLPDSIAGVGWVRTGDYGPRWRAYVADLQRGNMVVRVRMLTDGTLREVDFRTWVSGYSLVVSSTAPIVEPAP